jgi:hypothetical protein
MPDTKVCGNCAMEIPGKATICPHCRSQFPEYRRKQGRSMVKGSMTGCLIFVVIAVALIVLFVALGR